METILTGILYAVIFAVVFAVVLTLTASVCIHLVLERERRKKCDLHIQFRNELQQMLDQYVAAVNVARENLIHTRFDLNMLKGLGLLKGLTDQLDEKCEACPEKDQCEAYRKMHPAQDQPGEDKPADDQPQLKPPPAEGDDFDPFNPDTWQA